jgi:riboflavin synthase
MAAMFSGIVACTGRVAGVESASGAGLRLIVEASVLARPPGDGESVSVQGVCLTVVRTAARGLVFDVIGETLRRTTLGALVVDDRVNLESALCVGDPIGGHHVQGHVDGVGLVVAAEDRGDEVRVIVEAPDDVLATLVPQGFVAVDGASLTVADLGERRFTVALIPTTRATTTLGTLEPGMRVNLEGDPLGKHVGRWLAARA